MPMVVVSLVHSTVLSVPGFLSKFMVLEDFAATVSKFLPLALLFSMNEVFFGC